LSTNQPNHPARSPITGVEKNSAITRVATQRATKAGWHTSGDLVVPENLSLVFLPPYSPELNPIERLWLHLRDNRLSHCVF